MCNRSRIESRTSEQKRKKKKRGEGKGEDGGRRDDEGVRKRERMTFIIGEKTIQTTTTEGNENGSGG